MTHRITIPCRWQVEDLADGCKLLRMFINGQPMGTFLWDGTTLTERPVNNQHDVETKDQYHG